MASLTSILLSPLMNRSEIFDIRDCLEAVCVTEKRSIVFVVRAANASTASYTLAINECRGQPQGIFAICLEFVNGESVEITNTNLTPAPPPPIGRRVWRVS